LFKNELGYHYLDDWTDRTGNSNIKEGLLTAFLREGGDTLAQIRRTLHVLHRKAENHNRNPYGKRAKKGIYA
jgi:type I restriction enzyme R subunit